MENRTTNNALLSDDEKSLLVEVLKKRKPKLVEKVALLHSGKPDIDETKQVISVLIAESVDEGFDLNWELNEYGAKVEGLVDRLFALYWPRKRKTNYKDKIRFFVHRWLGPTHR